jgi:tetratricopeptide repeat protein
VSSPAGLESPGLEAAPGSRQPVAWPELTEPRPPAEAAAPPVLPRPGSGAKLALGLGAVLALVALIGKGGSSAGPMTLVEIALTALGTGALVAATLAAPTPRRSWGAVALFMLAALTAWTAVSVIWSVVPDASWTDANRAVAYLFAFAGAMSLARLRPQGAGSILGAVLVGSTAISIVALALKSFPVAFNSTQELARMRDPLDYWNALGLLAALAVAPALWLGARREGPPALRALGWPLLGIAGVVVALSYSRGVLIAVVVGVAFWFAVVPLRLRGLAVLLGGAAGAIAVSVWAFGQDALSKDRAPLPDRVDSGETLAVYCVLMALVLFCAGLVANRRTDHQPLSDRLRGRLGLGALGAGAAVLVAGAVALSLSGGGPRARFDRAWDNFFSTNSSATAYGPNRLKSIGTRRGSYWNDARKTWEAHRVLGVGANGYAVARKRYREDPVEVSHAHGYVPQTAADLGAIGIGLSLLALLAWIGAAARSIVTRGDPRSGSLDPRRLPAGVGRLGRWFARVPVAIASAARVGAPRRPVDADRIVLLTLATVVVMFGAHSLIDWTWFVPGTAVVALVCAGFVAGRGPRGVPGPQRTRPIGNRVAGALALAGVALVAVWTIWQPLRSERASDAALAALDAGRANDARVEAQEAQARDPLALRPLFDLSTIEESAGRRDQAQKALEQAVRLQPANPLAWIQLATYQLNTLQQPTVAFQSARAALFLDAKSPAVQSLFLDAYRKLPRKPVNPAQPNASGPGARDVLGALQKLRQQGKPQ